MEGAGHLSQTNSLLSLESPGQKLKKLRDEYEPYRWKGSSATMFDLKFRNLADGIEEECHSNESDEEVKPSKELKKNKLENKVRKKLVKA